MVKSVINLGCTTSFQYLLVIFKTTLCYIIYPMQIVISLYFSAPEKIVSYLGNCYKVWNRYPYWNCSTFSLSNWVFTLDIFDREAKVFLSNADLNATSLCKSFASSSAW